MLVHQLLLGPAGFLLKWVNKPSSASNITNNQKKHFNTTVSIQKIHVFNITACSRIRLSMNSSDSRINSAQCLSKATCETRICCGMKSGYRLPSWWMLLISWSNRGGGRLHNQLYDDNGSFIAGHATLKLHLWVALHFIFTDMCTEKNPSMMRKLKKWKKIMIGSGETTHSGFMTTLSSLISSKYNFLLTK